MSKIIVGISGGVDSAYTLHLLKSQGHDTIAVFLNMHGAPQDEERAKKCAKETASQFMSIDCKDLFSEKVQKYFKNEYIIGRTPNPCVVCNKEVKIRLLYNLLAELNADFIATGHYAKIHYDEHIDRYSIGISADKTKDQSYMLWMLDQNILSKLILPLGDLTKNELREKAMLAGLSSAESKDSTDICFIPDGNHAKWLEKNGAVMSCGRFLHANGRYLGVSKPIYNYTIGQRRGLGLAMDKSVFVTAIDANKGIVTVDYQEGLYTDSFNVDNLNYVGINDLTCLDTPIYVKIRYKSKLQKCEINIQGGICTVNAATGESFKAITPGQSAVFYDENEHILFGGLICS